MAMKIRSVIKVVALIFCFGSILLAQSETGKGEMHKVEKKHLWELGCLFKFYTFAELFLLNEDPFQLLYCQHLRTYSAIDTIGRRGQILLTFKDSSLIMEGLGLEKVDESPGTQLSKEEEQWRQPSIQFKDMFGVNLFPDLYWRNMSLYQGTFLNKLIVDKKYGGDVIIKVEKLEKSEKLIMNIMTPYDMVLPQVYPEMAKSIGGQVEYDAWFTADSPFIIATSDLDGDGLKEIIIGQGWYKTKAIFIWSRTSKNFYKLNEITEKILGFTDWENPKAKENCGLFEKGKITKINLKE